MKKTDDDYLTIVKMFTTIFGVDKPAMTYEVRNAWYKLTKMGITDRQWRSYKDEFNQMYRDDENDWYICGFPTGYVLTQDTEMIKRDMKNKRRVALAMLIRNSSTKEAIALKRQFRMDFEK